MKRVRNHVSDPVFVGPCAGKIELRIGESKRGESRIALLTPREAQQIAIALLSQAEDALTKG